jgi:hypothetical protein
VRVTNVMYESETTTVTAPMATRQPRRAQVVPRAACRDQVGQTEGRQDQPGLEHLGLEGQSDPDPTMTTLRRRPVRTAVTVESAARTSSRIIRESGMFPRSSVMVEGLAASTTEAARAASGPARRRTAW